MSSGDLAFVLVGDHLGQVKKVLIPSNEVSVLSNCATPSRANPVVSIQPIENQNKQIIANKNGELYLYDCVRDETTSIGSAGESLIKAIPLKDKDILMLYEKRIAHQNGKDFVLQKKGKMTNAKINGNHVAAVGVDIPLRLFDVKTRSKIYEADPPDKDWLGIKPEVYVSDLDFMGPDRVATCSKSDSVIRIYDVKAKPKPVISVNLDHTAFNEHAESARFMTIASTSPTSSHTVIVGSNVGQITAVDLRFNAIKKKPSKRFKSEPRSHKVLGSFKGPRGASIKDLKVVESGGACKSQVDDDDVGDDDGDMDDGKPAGRPDYKVISCCLDRYVRVHDFTRTSRQLTNHAFMITKPLCCSPVLYGG